MSCPFKKQQRAYGKKFKTKVKISFAVNAQLISAFVFRHQIRQCLFLYLKLEASVFCGCTAWYVSDWSETHIVGFLSQWLKCFSIVVSVWNQAPTLSCLQNHEVYVTDNSLPTMNVIDELLGTVITTDATNVHAEPNYISQGLGDIGRHVEVRVEASNEDSEMAKCAFIVNVKGR